MCRMDCPETIITDQGREFVNELSSALYDITNTEHCITSEYHPWVVFRVHACIYVFEWYSFLRYICSCDMT